MNDKILDILAQWPGEVVFGGKYIGVKSELEAELQKRRESLVKKTEELRRCPFCGFGAERIGKTCGIAIVRCPRCDIRVYRRSKQGADAAWNRRADHIPEAGEMMWISVEDRLPLAREDVLAVVYWHEAYQTLIAWHAPKSKVWHVTTPTGDKTDLHITHWMPLPKPPKMEGGEG